MPDVTEIDAITGKVTERGFTPEEILQRQADDQEQASQESILSTMSTNRKTLEQQAQASLAQNKAAIAATSPTNAQVVAQVKALSAQNNALIRLVLGLLSETE
jgi:hypothetical protein